MFSAKNPDGTEGSGKIFEERSRIVSLKRLSVLKVRQVPLTYANLR